MELPPPIHGQSTINKQVADILKDAGFPCIIINSGLSKTMGVKGKVTLEKFVLLFKLFYEVLKVSIFRKCKISYISIYPFGVPFLIYFIITLVLKHVGHNKIVLHLHAKGIKDKIENSILLKKCYVYLFNHTDVVIHLSNNLIKDILDVTELNKIRIIPNAVEMPEEILRKNSPHNPLRVLFLSNMVVAKGCLVTLEAAKRLLLSDEPFEFWFVGSWVQSNVVKEFESVLKDDRFRNSIKYFGPKYGDDKERILCESDIFIFPSSDECLPLVLIEAMQCGLPIITSDIGAIPEMVKTGINGYLIEKITPEALVDALLNFSRNPSLVNKMGGNSKLIYRSNYNYDLFKRNIIGLFKELIDN